MITTDAQRYYSGIGSRRTPTDIQQRMTKSAVCLDLLGYRLRSGGADGADTAFELGATHKDIFLPWPGFNRRVCEFVPIPSEAFVIAKRFHPAYGLLPNSVKNLMARNVMQILGADLETPSAFVLCWTPDGIEHGKDRTSKSGGTGQAISIASSMNIPIFNMKQPDALKRLKRFLDS